MGYFRDLRLPRTAWLSLFFILLCNLELAAQERPLGRGLRDANTAQNAQAFQFGLALNDILSSSADTSLYDPITLSSLRRLKADAEPVWKPEAHEIDPERTRRVAEKALAIQSGQSISNLIQESELRFIFKDIKEAFSELQDLFRYSLQSDGSGLMISKKNRGTKLLELKVEFNLKQGIDPQIRLGEHLRFRYDYVSKVPLLEYGLNF